MTDNKTLATFRLENQLWEAFKAEAAKNGTNASAALIAYCRNYVSGASRQASGKRIDERIDEVSLGIDIDNLDKRIDKHVQDAVAGAHEQLISQTSEILNRFQATIQRQQQQIAESVERVEAGLAGECSA